MSVPEFRPGCLIPLAYESEAIERIFSPCAPVASDEPIPPTLNAREWLTVENQGAFSSCCGQAFDKAREWCAWVGYRVRVNLSARMSYLAARKWAGVNSNGDNGVSIQAGAMAAKELGTVPEVDFPYWRDGERFDPRIPADVLEAAGKYRIGAVNPPRDARDIVQRLGTGQGPTGWGFAWTTGWASYTGGPLRQLPGGRHLGGHATAIIDYQTIDGELFLVGINSHGQSWGDRGFYTIHESVANQILNSSIYGAYTVTDLSGFQKRPFKFHEVMR